MENQNNSSNEINNSESVNSNVSNPSTMNQNVSSQLSKEFSGEQLTQMAKWSVDAGHLTTEQANKMLAEDGAPLLKPAVDPNSHAAYIDRIMPPAESKQFTIPKMDFDGDKTKNEGLAVDKLARTWLTEGRFTKEIGNYIADETSKVAEKFTKMSESEREVYKSRQSAMLTKVWGADANRKLELAKSLVDQIESVSPGLKAMLENTGAGNNAMIINQFAMQAQILLDRQRK